MIESREIGDMLALQTKSSRDRSRDRRRVETGNEQQTMNHGERREQRTKMKEVREEKVRNEKELVNKKLFFILQYSYSVLSKKRVHCSRIVKFIAFTNFDGECFLGFSR